MASDDFTGTDGAYLKDRANWNWISVGDAATSVTILSNALTIAADRFTGYYYTGSTTDLSQAVVSANFTSGHRHTPTVRTSSGNYGYGAYFSSGSGGNWTDITLIRNNTYKTSWGGLSYPSASSHTFKITASGTGATVTVTVYCDNNLIGSWDDSEAGRLTSGYSGVELYTNTTAGSPPFLDDWTDGGSASVQITSSGASDSMEWDS